MFDICVYVFISFFIYCIIQFVREIRGDSVADILDYVEYDPRRILEDLREAAERAVREKRITPSERYKILQTFEDGLRGYTYFER